MGTVKIRRKVSIIIYGIVVLLLFLGVGSICWFVTNQKENIDTRLMRVDVNQYVTKVEEVLSEGANVSDLDMIKLPEWTKGCTLIDMSGAVIWTNKTSNLHIGDKIEIKEFSGLNFEITRNDEYSFIAPMIEGGIQQYYLLLRIDAKPYIVKEGINPLLLIVTLFVIVIGVSGCILCLKTLATYIFQPMDMMKGITKAMANGDLDRPLLYDYDDESLEICHQIEALRQEMIVSQRREEQLKDNEKLLLACISHDLKTPLSTISGYVEGIRDGIVQDEEGVNRYANIVLGKVKILSKLIDDILEHSKTELDEMSIHLEEVYSDQYFMQLFSELSLDIEQSKRHLKIMEVPRYLVNLDKQRMSQVVGNIISNALKYSEEDTMIYVDFMTYLDEERKELVVMIKDEGKGISACDLPFVFDKFYRGEKARTQSVPGSGLGLHIARYIIEKHGGRIECDSILNHGTTILFSLPL